MLGGGEFIINGARTRRGQPVAPQSRRRFRHRPGNRGTAQLQLPDHSERGSWIEINVTRKEALRSGSTKAASFSIMTLLRAMNPQFSDDVNLLRVFFETEKEKVIDGRKRRENRREDRRRRHRLSRRQPPGRRDPRRVRQKITKNAAELICTSGLREVEVMPDPKNPILLNALAEDATASHEEALLRIYQRLRPAIRPSWKSKALFHEKFYDTNGTGSAASGRFRINRKLGLNVVETEQMPPAGRPDRRRQLSGPSVPRRCHRRNRRHRSLGQTGGCAPSTSWLATNSARDS